MDCLRRVAGDSGGDNLVDRQFVKALRAEDGEVELTLTFAPRCGSASRLAEAAFDALRCTLPNTDVYVMHSG